MKRYFLNSSGLGLVEVLVASVIAMIVIMGVGNIILDSQKAQKNVQLDQNAGFFANQMFLHKQNLDYNIDLLLIPSYLHIKNFQTIIPCELK